MYPGRAPSAIALLILSVIVGNNEAWPVKQEPSVITPSSLKYLQNYGYLNPTSSKGEGIYHETDVIAALKKLQVYGHIPATGKLDKATVKLMGTPRCGVADFQRNGGHRHKRFIIGSQGWRKTYITYYIVNWPQHIGERVIASELARAFDVWRPHTKLNFKRVYDESADIIVKFGGTYHGDAWPFDGPGKNLAHAYYPANSNSLAGDIHFDTAENWVIQRPNFRGQGTDFFSVAVHEIGHSLGLSHSATYEAVMYPMYKGYNPYMKLHNDDILGITTLYDEKTWITEPPTTTAIPEVIPDICDGNLDAAVVIGPELFVFKEQYLWRVRTPGIVPPNYPVNFHDLFHNIHDVMKLDAVYQRKNNNIVLFTGKKVWSYDIRVKNVRGPQYLTEFGIPENVTNIDAVHYSKSDDKLYLYSGRQLWIYDESRYTSTPSIFYRTLRPNLPTNIDAAITWTDGNVYYFKDKLLWKYDEVSNRTFDGYPTSATKFWFGCS